VFAVLEDFLCLLMVARPSYSQPGTTKEIGRKRPESRPLLTWMKDGYARQSHAMCMYDHLNQYMNWGGARTTGTSLKEEARGEEIMY